MARTPIRLIVCVDGTRCNPDQHYGERQGNITNIYRLYVSIKAGICKDAKGNLYDQQKEYLDGIGSQHDIITTNSLHMGVFGNKHLDQIRNVYEKCCHLTEQDEVWLYGFSRGAYVVRAVAGLLHYMRALTSAGSASFKEDYKNALDIYEKLQSTERLGSGEGEVHHLLSANTHHPPKIRFVGVFDTIKVVNDNSLFDVSLNDSIQNMRHALALNEERERLLPEYIYPNFGYRNRVLSSRSFIQAWFVGAHNDMGGSAEKDGLALYPLQWILIESRALGLILEFSRTDQNLRLIENPLDVAGLNTDQNMWKCKTKNGISIPMYDIHETQDPDGLYKTRYSVHLNKPRIRAWPKKKREPFDSKGNLNGYCEFASQGTIIHPSVYMCLDESFSMSLQFKDFPCMDNLGKCRTDMLGEEDKLVDHGFWNPREILDVKDPSAIRILVCGNTGVGKSSLINTVFGVEVTTSSGTESGKHNIQTEIKMDNRPDLIVHDSGGFEVGRVVEFEAVERFLEEKSREIEIESRLHIIWFCIDTSSCRPIQEATKKLFHTISKYAEEVPIIVVCTKKDRFLAIEQVAGLEKLENDGLPPTMAAAREYANTSLQNQLDVIGHKMLDVKGGRFDACVAVSIEDKTSIDGLTTTTAQAFTHDRIRLLYIRAQVSLIDLKIDLALRETMHIYKRTVRNATAATMVPLASSSNRGIAVISVCKAIIACFGLPNISAETAYHICKANVWDDAPNNLHLFISEGFTALAIGATVLTAGLPLFLVPLATNIHTVVPATARLLLMLVCDLILILIRAFRETTNKRIGQLLERDLVAAASAYRTLSKEVHERISFLVPKGNIVKSHQVTRITSGVEQILREYKHRIVEAVEMSRPSDSQSDDTTTTSPSSAATTETPNRSLTV